MSPKPQTVDDVKKRLVETLAQHQQNLAYVQGCLDSLEHISNKLRENPKLDVTTLITELVASGLESERKLKNAVQLLQLGKAAAKRIREQGNSKKPEGSAIILPAYCRR